MFTLAAQYPLTAAQAAIDTPLARAFLHLKTPAELAVIEQALAEEAAEKRYEAVTRASALAQAIIHDGVYEPSSRMKLEELGGILRSANISLADLGMTTRANEPGGN